MSRSVSDDQCLSILLARWRSRAQFQEELEAVAHEQLASDDPVETASFVHEHLMTEQAEYIAEFLYALRVSGCHEPERMAAWLDQHNKMVSAMLEDFQQRRADRGSIGPGEAQQSWRLADAFFTERMCRQVVERLGDGRLILSLKDFHRFMTLHMDPGLCRDRLNAFVKIGLLNDERRPNLRIFWSDGKLEEIVRRQLSLFHNNILESGE